MMSRRHHSQLVTYGLQVKWAGGGQAGSCWRIHADTTDRWGVTEYKYFVICTKKIFHACVLYLSVSFYFYSILFAHKYLDYLILTFGKKGVLCLQVFKNIPILYI